MGIKWCCWKACMKYKDESLYEIGAVGKLVWNIKFSGAV
jgi:hypothetical protein